MVEFSIEKVLRKGLKGSTSDESWRYRWTREEVFVRIVCMSENKWTDRVFDLIFEKALLLMEWVGRNIEAADHVTGHGASAS